MKINSFVGTGILTALSSSVCCMLPAVSLLAGASGMATSFLWLQPYRPYLITLSIISLGIAWYNVLFREKDEVCGCEKKDKRPFLTSKAFLIIVTISAVLLITFPSYSHLFMSRYKNNLTVPAPNTKTITIPVKGMMCAGCEMYIEEKLHKLAGVQSVKASHTDENTIIQFDDNIISIDELVEAINKLHYQAIHPKDDNADWHPSEKKVRMYGRGNRD